jgi:hypothetical protein
MRPPGNVPVELRLMPRCRVRTSYEPRLKHVSEGIGEIANHLDAA